VVVGDVVVSRVRNRMPSRYREVAVTNVDLPLVRERLREHFLGREAYRRTRYIAVRGQDGAALIEVAKASEEPLFSPITAVEVLAGPTECAWLTSPDVDVGIPTQVCEAALEGVPGARCVVVQGRYEHVSFILDPEPVRIRVVEVAPPRPPKLLDQARRVLEVAEDLPPVRLEPEIVDIVELARQRPSRQYLYPCRGSGAAPDGAEVFYLDERPSRRDWVLVSCERSREIHRHFYGDEPPHLEICPSELVVPGDGPVLTKCCQLEESIERDGLVVRVPWGATLAEVRAGIEMVLAAVEPTWASS
jgi:hypothetical protein